MIFMHALYGAPTEHSQGNEFQWSNWFTVKLLADFGILNSLYYIVGSTYSYACSKTNGFFEVQDILL